MATNGTLQLGSNYVQTGLGTLTFTVPATLPPNNISVVNVPFEVLCQVSFPQDVGEGAGSGSGADQGLGVNGGSSTFSPTYQTTGAQQALGNGQLGLGFGGSNTDGASGNGSGLGSGSGGGVIAQFSQGGGGLGDGSKGLGFGSANSGYNQPPAYTNSPTSFAGILSSLSVLVKQNGSTIYTAPTIAGNQLGLQFKTSFLANAADSITVVLSSSLAADNALQAIKANVSIGVGE